MMVDNIGDSIEMLALVKPDVIVLAHTATSYHLGRQAEADLVARDFLRLLGDIADQAVLWQVRVRPVLPGLQDNVGVSRARRHRVCRVGVAGTATRHADQELQQLFITLYDQKHAIQTSAGHAELDIGPDDWPLPIPIVESNGGWTFDTKAGEQTIVDRRIGRNELRAIHTLLACVDAQRDYFERARQATGTGVYATRLLSTPGHQDGLYWRVAEGATESPLGPLVDAAQEAGYLGESGGGDLIPYEGYYFHILTAQGPNSDGGAKNYIQSGRMTGGFALVAWPARFEASGIMTFIIGPNGDVYQKDLGPDTARIAAAMTTFDSDLTWAHIMLTNE